MRIVSNASEGAIDPQINCISQFWQAFFNVYDGLVTFGKTNGEAGDTVVPDRAKALPKGPSPINRIAIVGRNSVCGSY